MAFQYTGIDQLWTFEMQFNGVPVAPDAAVIIDAEPSCEQDRSEICDCGGSFYYTPGVRRMRPVRVTYPLWCESDGGWEVANNMDELLVARGLTGTLTFWQGGRVVREWDLEGLELLAYDFDAHVSNVALDLTFMYSAAYLTLSDQPW